MSWIAGIDYSTHAIDVVYVDENGERPPMWERTKLEGADAWERTRTIDNGIAHSAWWDDVLAVGVEEPRGMASGVLYRVQGAIIANLPPRVLVQPWVPSEWRKAVGLPGNASKEDVMDYVVSTGFGYGWKTDEVSLLQDACDAYCIALATRGALEQQAAA